MRDSSLSRFISDALQVPGLRIIASPAWSSSVPASRESLRRAIAAVAGADESLGDLTRTPCLEGHSLSISHHRTRGGFAIAPRSEEKALIGFDMELRSRAIPRLVGRVCEDSTEFETAPDSCALFTAKEAAFKSLFRRSQPRGLKDIRIGAWKSIRGGAFRCEALGAPGSVNGVVVIGTDECWAVFASRPEMEAKCAGF